VRLVGALALALGSAALLNVSLFVQHQATGTMAPLTLRHPIRSLLSLFCDLRWLAGWGAGIGGWALYVVAVLFAPLSLVQAVSAGGIGVLAILARRRPGRRDEPGEGLAVAFCLAGLALLLVSFAGGVPTPATPGPRGILAWVGVSGAAAAAAAGLGWRLGRLGAGLGAAAGLLYAAGDISTKGAVDAGAVFVPLLLACHLLGFLALQLSFQRGGALATAGLATLLGNLVPIAAGIVAFHERIPAGAPGAARLVSFALVVAGAVLLARPEGSAQPAGGADTPVTLR
jgi:hypothetical protein